MATRTETRTSSRSRSESRARNAERGGTESRNRSERRSTGTEEQSAFSWGRGNTGAMVGAALAGVAIGLAANMGRKFLTQSMSGLSGDWDEVLATEHEMTLAIFDKMLATDETQTWKRNMLLMKLEHALDKHAHEEEMIVYPALREANMAHDADALNSEHLEIKTFLYELHQMGPDSPRWLDKVREFRGVVQRHARMEEDEIFPRFKEAMTDEQNARITSLVNRDGFWQA